MTDGQETEDTEQKLPIGAHVACGWPLILVILGGAIGGACGGAAYAANVAIYKSSMPLAAKVALIMATGLAAIFLYLLAVAALQSFIG